MLYRKVPETFKILKDPQEIIDTVTANMETIRDHIYVCGDRSWPVHNIIPKPVVDAFCRARDRGVQIRFITEITKDNVSAVKENMKFGELRHLDNIDGNFGVSEHTYFAAPSWNKRTMQGHHISSNSRLIIDQGRRFFETLWEKAVPAEDKIREIEEGKEVEFFEAIRDPDKLIKIGRQMVKKAEKEVLILFSSSAGFRRQKKAGLIDYLANKKKRLRNLSIRILAPMDESMERTARDLARKGIVMAGIEQESQTRLSLSIVDRRYCLSAELREDRTDSSHKTVSFGFYSNSEATVFSYISIFETLWNQANLYHKLRQLNNQLQVANENLQNNDRLQKEFINVAAHELRTPIQPILGLSQTLRENSPYPGQHEFLDAIIRNSKRLHRLAEEILQVSRIESNLLKLNCEEFDLDELVREIIDDIKSRQNEGPGDGISFSIRIKNVRMYGDRSKLGEVIGNLVDNALKFTPKGRIDISAKNNRNGDILVSVKDQGSGIPAEIMPRLFTKFVSKSDGGTGLGLYICKNVVEAHRGEIWAQNNVGKGATFWLSVPGRKVWK